MQLSGDPGRPYTLPLKRLLQRARPGTPLHRQIESGLRGLIDSGQVAPGAVLPGELELATELGVSRHTLRHALGALTAEGLLRRSRGRGGGTTVLRAPDRPIERSLGSFYAFAWEVRARGRDPRSFVLERETRPPEAVAAQALGLPAGAMVQRIVRVRTADGEPLVLETSWLPERVAASLDTEDLEHDAIYDVLERKLGLRVERAHERMRAIVLDARMARLLGVPRGSPALFVERTTYAHEGPIEWQESIVRGDRFLYSVDLPRIASGLEA
jgi:GntR family transcriptional regulator